MMRVREFGRGGGAGLMQASICSRSDVYVILIMHMVLCVEAMQLCGAPFG